MSNESICGNVIHETIQYCTTILKDNIRTCAIEYIEWCDSGVLPQGGVLRNVRTTLNQAGLTSEEFVLRGLLMDIMAKHIADTPS